MKILKYCLLLALSLSVMSCEDALKEDIYSQIAPEAVLTTEEGMFALLSSAYGHATYPNRWGVNLAELPTDIAYQSGGFENGITTYYMNFTWDPSTPNLLGFYTRGYDAIRDANYLLEYVDEVDMPDETKALFKAEARFVRALSYARMYYKFGPVPLRTTIATIDDMALPRPEDEVFKTFIVDELLAVIDDLPKPGQEAAYGRATQGAAMGVLCKLYLNTKQWQKAADMAQEVIDLNYYGLYPVFEDMLKVENEMNKEMIWVNIAVTNSIGAHGNNYISPAFPPGFKSWPEKGLNFMTNWKNPQSQYRLRDEFYYSFDPADERREAILTQYVNKGGVTVDLLATPDNTRSFRFWPDPDAQGEKHGNDVPEVRYADILLSRAEALNELNGPTQAALDLIDQVRLRAGLGVLDINDFDTKEDLRNHILKERGWEFYNEGLRRQDLIRMGKFIEFARNRGVSNAMDYHVLYPLPSQVIDSNPLLEEHQNDGY